MTSSHHGSIHTSIHAHACPQAHVHVCPHTHTRMNTSTNQGHTRTVTSPHIVPKTRRRSQSSRSRLPRWPHTGPRFLAAFPSARTTQCNVIVAHGTSRRRGSSQKRSSPHRDQHYNERMLKELVLDHRAARIPNSFLNHFPRTSSSTYPEHFSESCYPSSQWYGYFGRPGTLRRVRQEPSACLLGSRIGEMTGGPNRDQDCDETT
jgi:hypothetical protein